MRFRRTVATAMAAAASAAVLVVLPASQTQAASYPTCNATSVEFLSSTRVTIQPVYAGTGSRNCVMGRGAQSKAVRFLQDVINTCYGLSTGGIDGIYGPRTQQAVETVQDRENASVDGVYGPETRRKMDWIIYRRSGLDRIGCAEPGI